MYIASLLFAIDGISSELDASPEEEPAASLQNLEERGGDLLTSTHDTDIVRLEGQLDEWNLALRQNILVSGTVSFSFPLF